MTVQYLVNKLVVDELVYSREPGDSRSPTTVNNMFVIDKLFTFKRMNPFIWVLPKR